MPRWIVRTPLDVVAPSMAAGSADLPGSVGGLGMTWDVVADNIGDVWPDLPSTADVVRLTRLAGDRVALRGRRIKRTLLFRVRPGTPTEVLNRFESELGAMPEYITSIASWTLSRTTHPRWTHAWEQEFAGLDGLNGEYLLHPYHWTCVDRWFDPEVPQYIVDPEVAHVFRWADGPLLS